MGWDGLVWDGAYDPGVLSRKGLTALSQHPLMRTVCVDRSFWRPLSVEQYAQMAAQVPEDFRFVVKCPNVVTDALVRGEDGKGQQRNPVFLDAGLAVQQFVEPALQGLGSKLGSWSTNSVPCRGTCSRTQRHFMTCSPACCKPRVKH